MKLLFKIIGFTLAGIVGLLVIAFIAVQFISDEQYKKWISGAAESATGRVLTINGEFDVQIGTKLGLSANDISFANAEWGSRAEMVSADRLFVQVELLPLVKGVLDFTVELDAPDILMETDAEGKGNWQFAASDKEPEPEQKPEKKGEDGSFALPFKPYIRNFEIKDLVFVFNDTAKDKNIEAAVETFRIFVDGTDVPISLKAMYQGAPVELGGSLGNIEEWHANQQTPISLTGALNEAALSIEGSAGPMLPQPNARIDVALTADNVSTFSAFAGTSLPSLQGLDVSLSVAAEDGHLATKDVNVNLNDPRLRVAANGNVADLTEMSGIDLTAELNSEYAAELMQELTLEIPYSLPQTLSFKADVTGNREKLSVSGLEFIVKDQGLDVNLTGTLENVLGSGGGSANLSINLESTSIIGNYIGQDVPGFGPVTASAKVSSGDTTIQLESLQVELQDPAAQAKITGSAESIGRSAGEKFEVKGIEINAEAGSTQLNDIMAKLGIDVPVELPASFDLSVSSAGSLEKLGITDLQATVKDNGVDVNLSGTVDNVIDLSGIAVQLKATADDTANLSKFAAMELPALGSLSLNAKALSEGETYRLESLELGLDGEAAKVNVKGAVNDLQALTKVGENSENYGAAGIEASLNIDAASVTDLLNKMNIEVAEIGKFHIDGYLGSSAQSIKLYSLNAVLENEGLKTKASLTLEDVIGLTGLKAVIDADLKSLSSLSALAKKELPETGPWVVHIQADSENPDERKMKFFAKLNGEGIDAVVDAELPDVKAPQTFQSQLAVDVESMVRLGELLGKPVVEDKPLKITGKAAGKPGEIHLNDFLVETKDAEIRADLAYLAPPQGNVERKNLSGTVTINNFDFVPLLVSKEKEAEAEQAEAQPEAKEKEKKKDKKKEKKEPATGKKLFSSEPLSAGALQEYDVDLKLDATNVKLREGIRLDGKLAVKLDQGLLEIDPLQFDQSNGGTGNGYITLDTRTPAAKLDAEIDFDEVVAPRIGGLIDVSVDLEGEGKSVAELMGSLNGHFVTSLKDVELFKSFMSQFGAGLLSHLNPLDSEKTTLECAIVRFDIADGIADFEKKIAAQTSEVTWLGGGEINLKTEELDVGISPKARGAVSSLTNIDLASLVHIGGTLAEPKIGVDVADVAKKYVGYTAFVATGGLSFLAQKMVETKQANVDQCERILSDLENKK